jgi:hypothetical protein
MDDARQYFEHSIMQLMAGPTAQRIFNTRNGHPPDYSSADAVCHHEAGHATAALLFGMPVCCVEVDARGGRVWAHPPNDEARQAIIISDADHIATKSGFISELTQKPCNLVGLEAETEIILRDNWNAVWRIAQALCIRTGGIFEGRPAILRGEEVREIFGFYSKHNKQKGA